METPRLTALEILRQLNKSNCRECGENTCMAFAASVIRNQKRLSDCPYLEPSVASALSLRQTATLPPDQSPERFLNQIKDRIRELDFEEAADRLGLALVNGRLRVHVLGAIFDVDSNGDLHTLRHVNHWIHGPLLHYLLYSQGKQVVGNWIPYSQLKNVEETAPFFAHFCENAFQRLADDYTDLFFQVLQTFGRPIENGLVDADFSIRLMPLPRLPCLYSYWKSEGEFPSKLAIHFDETANVNLDPRSILFLAAGLSAMFNRFIEAHSG